VNYEYGDSFGDEDLEHPEKGVQGLVSRLKQQPVQASGLSAQDVIRAVEGWIDCVIDDLNNTSELKDNFARGRFVGRAGMIASLNLFLDKVRYGDQVAEKNDD
jgi:hypothetical protein